MMNATASLEAKVNELTRKNTLLESRLNTAMDYMSHASDDFNFIDVMENEMEMTFDEIATFLIYRYDFTEDFRDAMEYLADNFYRDDWKQVIADMMTNEALRMYRINDSKSLNVMHWFVDHWNDCGLSDDFLECHLIAQMQILNETCISDLLDFVSMILSGIETLDRGTQTIVLEEITEELKCAAGYLRDEKGE